MLFLRAGNETNNSKKKLPRKLNWPGSAKLLRADGPARAPIPAALYPAGLKIATEIRARTDAEIGRIPFVIFFFFRKGLDCERGRASQFTFLWDLKPKEKSGLGHTDSSGFRQLCTQQYKYMQTVKTHTHTHTQIMRRKHANTLDVLHVGQLNIERKSWFI